MKRRRDPSAIPAMVTALRKGVVRRTMLPLTHLASGHTVRIGVLHFRGYWTGDAAQKIESIKARLPGASWVRLGGPGGVWTREVRT